LIDGEKVRQHRMALGAGTEYIVAAAAIAIRTRDCWLQACKQQDQSFTEKKSTDPWSGNDKGWKAKKGVEGRSTRTPTCFLVLEVVMAQEVPTANATR
jgi:hypothetical protein